jgi:hypothetical protein
MATSISSVGSSSAVSSYTPAAQNQQAKQAPKSPPAQDSVQLSAKAQAATADVDHDGDSH